MLWLVETLASEGLYWRCCPSRMFAFSLFIIEGHMVRKMRYVKLHEVDHT